MLLAYRFDQICGNEHARRAAEVALAGWHKIVFIGSQESEAENLAYVVNCISNVQDELRLAEVWQPCPCGHYGDPEIECTCDMRLVGRWLVKNPLPIADIYVEVTRPNQDKILHWATHGFSYGEQHDTVMARIEKAWDSKPKVDQVDQTAWQLLSAAVRQLHLHPSHARSITGVARTIAKMAGCQIVQACHMAEAIQYRPRSG